MAKTKTKTKTRTKSITRTKSFTGSETITKPRGHTKTEPYTGTTSTSTGTNTKRTYSGNPFDVLLDESKIKKLKPVSLDAFQKPNTRKENRLKSAGIATIFDTGQKISTRAALRNISPNGLGFEILALPPIKREAQVFVQFESPNISSLIDCTVQWIADIETSGNKMIGLKINKMTPTLQRQMKIFFKFVFKD